jgi:hypothetical protein
MTEFKRKLDMEHMEVVDCEGKGGGLAVLWRRDVDVVVRGKSKYYIDMEVSVTGESAWRFTGMYGEPHADIKYKTWDVLRKLHGENAAGLPWLCAGDFNEILFHHEKEGGVPRSQACLNRFKEALEWCDLTDLGLLEMCSRGETRKQRPANISWRDWIEW